MRRARVGRGCFGGVRRGGVYVLVLVVTALVTGMVMLGLRAAMAVNSQGVVVGDSIAARHRAASAVELGLDRVLNETDWRVSRASGAWIGDLDLGGGRVRLVVDALDGGSYSEDASEPVRLTGEGRVGGARSVVRARVGMAGLGTRDFIEALYDGRPLAYWPLHGVSGSGYEADEVRGNSLSASWSGDEIVPGAVPGLGLDTAPWFSGAGSMVAASRDAYTRVRSVSVWFRAEDVTGLRGVVTRDASGRGDGGRWEIAVYNGELQSLFDTVSRTVTLSGGVVEAGRWHHALLTVDSGGARLYLDGVRVDQWGSIFFSAELEACSPSESIRVGVSRRTQSADGSGTNHFRGSISHLALLERSRDDSQVRALFEAHPPPARYVVVTDSWERVVE